MQKQKDIITIQDKSFSKKLLDLSSLKSCNVESTPFDTVTKAHGALIQDQNNNILFDLRLQSEKPFWGHSHPIIIKKSLENNIFINNLNSINIKNTYILNHLNFNLPIPKNKTIIQNNLSFSNNDKLKFVDSDNDYFIELYSNYYVNINEPVERSELPELFHYIETALIKGKRVLNIQEAIKGRFPKALTEGLLIIFETDIDDIILKAQACGIYINQNNTLANKVYLSIPTSFTNLQFNDLLNRLELFFGELKCL